jgi:acyl-CoA reductase-like NAD-dependent aldehyde dehydrogenase
MNTASRPAQITLAHPEKLYIGGRWQAAAKQGRIAVVSPHNESICMTVAEATEPDMDAAVQAARNAFDAGPWPRLSHLERADYLRRMSAALEARLPELARAWVEQTGALASVAPFVIAGGKQWFDFYADMADKFDWQETRPLNDGPGFGLVVREPVGVYVAIAPWNNPFGIMTGKIAPALLAGCTVIMKPAPETPIEAYIIAEAAEEVGLPDGVINLVPAHRDASDQQFRRRQGQLHGVGNSRCAHRIGVREQDRALHAGTGGQVRGSDSGGLRHGGGCADARADDNHVCWPGVRNTQSCHRAQATS